MPYILKVISEDRALLESAFCFIFLDACIKSAEWEEKKKDEGDSLKESNAVSLCTLPGSMETLLCSQWMAVIQTILFSTYSHASV